jgi:hypothetical protein
VQYRIIPTFPRPLFRHDTLSAPIFIAQPPYRFTPPPPFSLIILPPLLCAMRFFLINNDPNIPQTFRGFKTFSALCSLCFHRQRETMMHVSLPLKSLPLKEQANTTFFLEETHNCEHRYMLFAFSNL